MSVSGTFRLDKPDEALATVTLTMTVKEWKDLRKQMSEQVHPSWRVVDVIADLVRHAEAHFYGRSEEPSP